ncbi:MAG TPA: DUF6502 family protein [Steroidobacteraceae bacterium]|nr:DUF6502 family protein [Steroidobacteraceae bacterium]
MPKHLATVRRSRELPRVSEKTRRGSDYPHRKGKPSLKEGSHADLQHLLGELALALLPRGVTPNSFFILAREAFVRAAAGNSRLKNGKVNHSKVAAITGLPRKEIRRILNRTTASLGLDRTTRMPSERVMQGWLTDRRFLTRKGEPKPLAIGRGSVSFQRLVKEYGGDISPRAVLQELLRAGTVCRAGERLKVQRSKLPIPRSGFGTLARVIPTLVDGLRIASRQPASPIDSSLYRLKLYAPNAAELALLRERCSSSVQSLLYGLSESLERQVTVPLRKRSSSRHALTVTVLLVETSANSGLGDINSKR